jgi:protein-disulfide isomerase
MKWDRILTSVLVICALITTGLVVHRELSVPSTRSAPEKPVFIENWKSHLKTGVQLDGSSAPVQLIEFADFECPYCATFRETLKAVRDRYPTKVALSYVHYPLPGHRFAEPAARAAECADDQGRFERMHDLLFEQQDKLGLKPWDEFAIDAGVPDLAAFTSCIQSSDPVRRITQGRQLAEQLDVKGTPTLIINGWKLAYPPSMEELDRMVKAVIAGESPVSGDG